MPQDTAKQVSRHEGANEAIELLRTSAAFIKQLGDENVKLRIDTDFEHERQLERLEETIGDLQECVDDYDGWRLAIEDYERGLLDRDELFQRTIRCA